ncbi:ribonucleotide-diphosphate reductase subunit alpha, partial [candidate division GN15 bacterium]
YRLAWSLGCKGVTIYRDNSRPHQVLSTTGETTAAIAAGHPVEKRPPVLAGFTEKITTGYGNLYVTVNIKDGRPFEVFAHIGKSGYTTMADTEAICRLVSLTLRSGVAVGQVIKQLRGIGGSSQVYSSGARVFSIPDAIAQILNRHFGESAESPQSGTAFEMCPECSGPIKFESGCFSCPSCGYSTC